MNTSRITLVRLGPYCQHRNRLNSSHEFVTLPVAKRFARRWNRCELLDPCGQWARIDRRRGWLVIEYYGGEGN